ncbi:MAG TPA: FAD-binding protein, partial [Hanamia sp.]|nr:FAD-binding protein [Hanamia sp.]
MQKIISLRLLPSDTLSASTILNNIAISTGKKVTQITGFHLLKKSIDARGKTVWVNLSVNAFIDEPFYERILQQFDFKDVSNSTKKIIIIGGGPAGIFAALQLLECGVKP